MKILFSSHFFAPSVGGIEQVGGILAAEFVRRGHEVVVVTQSPGDVTLPYEVRRRPGFGELPRLTRWCDVVFHNNISLQTAWPLLGIHRPWVVAHHTWIARTDGTRALADRVKLRAIRSARNIAVSRAIATNLRVNARVIPNPYQDDLFRITNTGSRTGDVLFLGRLVSDKGADILLEALAIAKVRATIVGDGPERQALQAQARRLGIDATFAGVREGEDLVAMLNDHRVLVAPSRWEEPFGLVALEAMACGCVPIVARSGGLPEAVGDAGVIFEKRDASGLAQCIDALLQDEVRLAALRQRAPAHLERHRAEVIAAQYLEVLEEAAR